MSNTSNENSTSNKKLLNQLEENTHLIQQLKQEIEILRNIISLIPGNVYWKDKQGKFLGCNNNVAKILGCHSPKEVVGKSNSDLFDTNFAALADQIDKEVWDTTSEHYIEELGLNIAKEPATYLTKKLSLFDDSGNKIGMLGVSFDITERKKIEEDLKIAKEKAEESSRAKSQFLAVINHELRTPLTGIIGLMDFLKQDDLADNEREKVFEAIQNCTRHLLNLVNDVLDFTQLETQKYNLRLEKTSLSAIVNEVRGMLQTLVDNKGLDFHIYFKNTPKYILTDPIIIKQILINLIGNAIKFTEKGSIEVEIIGVNQTEQHATLQLNITDTGIGIPPDKFDIIFEPFEQLEDAYTRQSSRSGTGLGLTIVKKLSLLIGAKIQLKSTPGQGSSFSLIGDFKIPVNQEKPVQPESLNEKKITKIFPPIKEQKPNILLVEDDPIVQYVHKKMLEDLGCNVDVVSKGKEAIKALNHHLMFVDISLPDISGFDIIKSIREKHKNKDMPIIALTVFTGKNEKQACLEAGANEFASKPISKSNLKKLLLKYGLLN